MDASSLKTIILPIHREGWFFIAIAGTVTFLLALLSPILGWIGAIFTVWIAYFFRDPERTTPLKEGLIISPADGIISAIVENVRAPAELEFGDETWTRVSVFLNIFDVHINRIPVSGEIIRSHYHPGKFLNASLDKASDENERQVLAVKPERGPVIVFVQIAGLIARRIRCDVSEGSQVMTGQRYGLIRFGSRVDVYLPKGMEPLVMQGQRMIGGETVIADVNTTEMRRNGVIR
jgi:phosphatidylserine decarboxylase